jgi:hypothetical protein
MAIALQNFNQCVTTFEFQQQARQGFKGVEHTDDDDESGTDGSWSWRSGGKGAGRGSGSGWRQRDRGEDDSKRGGLWIDTSV